MSRPPKRGSAPPSALRPAYERHGVAGYYAQHGSDYRNPHEPVIARLIAQAVQRWQLPLGHVLDLACGSGEATLALQPLGATSIAGIDPYTGAAYAARTGQAAEPLSFAQIAQGALAGGHYPTIVCSFALHLAPASLLPMLTLQLSLVGDYLLVLTPHKRPQLRAEWGWALLGELSAERVRARCYQSNLHQLTTVDQPYTNRL